jgi:branched-chain amino acid transport system ATP-binding protein
VLTCDAIDVSYGRVDVLRGLCLTADHGQILTVLGPNGSGKSTMLKAVAGVVRVRNGSVRLHDDDITKHEVGARVRAGITLVPQGRRLFGGMTVEENLRLGAYIHRANPSLIDEMLERWMQFFPVLKDKRHLRAGGLSGGEQQMVAVARGLMSQPKLLLLDEPSLGIAPKISAELAGMLPALRDEHGITIVLVEQNVRLALEVADRVIVLKSGRNALEGSPRDFDDKARLTEIYLS